MDLIYQKDWLVAGDLSQVHQGYSLLPVRPADWERITADVTFARRQAQIELD